MKRTKVSSFGLAAAVVAVVGAKAGGGWRIAERRAATARASVIAAAALDAATESDIRVKDIAFYEGRAASDRESAGDRTQIASLYFQLARETGDFQYYLRAEGSARASIALRTQHNGAAYAVLMSALLAQHRFVEAREAARRLAESEPDVAAFRAMLGETCLELGDYACADSAFGGIAGKGQALLSVAPRLARWAEVRGDTARARALLTWARSFADNERELPREQRAWFHLRVADLDFRQGRLDRAEDALKSGLDVMPNDHRLLAAMARLAAARHHWRDAVMYGDSSIAIVLDPATLGIIADAYTALGDTANAAEYARTMEVVVGQQPGAYHRAWSLFLLDHGRQSAQVLAAAEAELVNRREIYGYDLVAWALYKNGRPREARHAMVNALAQGTQDAMLFYHAGMIERALGNRLAAREYLNRALKVAPNFDPAGPVVARAVIDTLDRQRLVSR